MLTTQCYGEKRQNEDGSRQGLICGFAQIVEINIARSNLDQIGLLTELT